MSRISTERPIILVDDDPMEEMLFRRYMEKSAFCNELIYIQGSDKFLEYLLQVKNGVKLMPALVLLDINMPEMNGHECLLKVRGDKEFQEVPIIVMYSNSSNRVDIERAMSNGANNYIVKPKGKDEFTRFFESLESGTLGSKV